jgi:hypothetical protein
VESKVNLKNKEHHQCKMGELFGCGPAGGWAKEEGKGGPNMIKVLHMHV